MKTLNHESHALAAYFKQGNEYITKVIKWELKWNRAVFYTNSSL